MTQRRPMTPRHEGVWGQFEGECQELGCSGKRKFEQAHSAGLRIGDMVPEDLSNPMFGRCPLCRKYTLKIVAVPPQATPPGPKGFTKVPTE